MENKYLTEIVVVLLSPLKLPFDAIAPIHYLLLTTEIMYYFINRNVRKCQPKNRCIIKHIILNGKKYPIIELLLHEESNKKDKLI